MAKIGMILEGGGNRAIYTAGVLDVFMENNIAVDGVIGVSAGAIHACNYVSKQIGRSLGCAKLSCENPQHMGVRSLIKTGDYFGAKFCYYDIPQRLYPFDNDTFEKSATAYYVTCTDVHTGEAVYQQCLTLRDEMVEWIRASASMPLVSRIVDINGQKLLDGGIADSIPLEAFQKLGYQRNIVILTRIAGYRKKPNLLMPLMKRRMKQYPQFLHTAENRHIVYNNEVEYVEQAEKNGEIFLIRPQEYVNISRTEKDVNKINQMYELGRRDALAQLEQVKDFIHLSKKI